MKLRTALGREFWSSGLLHCVAVLANSHVSKGCGAFIFQGLRS